MSTFAALYDATVSGELDLTQYYWMVIVGGIACFTMGFGIGANDVANNLGSSVGSGALSFRVAIVLAAIFELVGAVALGASVTDSIRKGIIKPEAVEDHPDLLMWANLSALLTGTCWLLFCSSAGMPVSTTHTVIGCLLGAGLAMPGGASNIDWGYMGTVVASWFLSPIACMVFAGGFFVVYRHFVLRKETEKALKLAKNSLWITVWVTLTVFGVFFVVKTPATKDWATENVGLSVGYGCIFGLICTLIVTPLFQWFASRKMRAMDLAEAEVESEAELAKMEAASRSNTDESGRSRTSSSSSDEEDHKNPSVSTKSSSKPTSNQDLFDEVATDEENMDCNEIVKKKWYSLPWFMDLRSVALADAHIAERHDKSEKFHPRVEQYFAYLQVITATFECVTHGSNDVANATAPFASIYGLYTESGFSDTVETPYWILALGGSAIGVGVFFLGHKVIMSLGFKIAKITPGRGFCVELGSVLMMTIGSFAGLPLSTTHCKVGGTLAIGLLEKPETPKRRNLNGRISPDAIDCRFITKIVVSWVATVVVGALLSAALFALGAYSPSVN